MDRPINYPGQVPLETDLLLTNQSVMVGLAKLSQAIFGTAGMATGFGTTQTVVPSLNVLVAPGEIYSQQNLEATAVSSLPQDTAHTLVKQGILLDAATIPIAPPGTAGFSINYLIQVAYQDSDAGSTVLPYYNASNPAVAYSGPANSGAAQPTIRKGIAVVSAKAGTAATTGTQTTPAPDAGKLGLYVVTVANGASSIVNANVSAYAGAPLVGPPISQGRLLGVQVFTASAQYTPTPGMRVAIAEVQAAGNAGAGASLPSAGNISLGSPGGAGAYGRGLFTAAQIGAGQFVTVGAAGVPVSGAAGGAGGASSFGSLLSAQGGIGSQVLNNFPAANNANGNSSLTAAPTGANLFGVKGACGALSMVINTGVTTGILGGPGGASYFGAGGVGAAANSTGSAASGNYGSGGGGVALTSAAGVSVPGGAATGGIVLVWEYA